MTDIEIALTEWKALEIVDTWDLPADHPAYLAKCAAYARYMALALVDTRKAPETPLLPAVCPSGRIAGVIGYVCRDYGYIRVEGEDDVKFFPRHVLGIRQGAVLMRGDKVTFTRGMANNAIDVVLSDLAASVEVYNVKCAQRPATPRVRRGRATDGGGFQFTENADELVKARERVAKLRGE